MAARLSQEGDDFAADPRSIDLRDYWQIIRRRWLAVLVMTLVGGLAGAGYAYTTAALYSATSQVVVTGATQGPGSPTTSGPNTQVNMSTEQAVAQSSPVIARAAGLLGRPVSLLQAEASKRLSVLVPASSISTSNVLQITWQATSGRSAAQGADAFADAYLSYRHQELASQIAQAEKIANSQLARLQKQVKHLYAEESHLTPGTSEDKSLSVRISQLNGQSSKVNQDLQALGSYDVTGGTVIRAAVPTSPSGLGHSAFAVIGALIGLLIGLVLAFIRDAFDDRIREPGQLEAKLGATTLAVLPPAEDAPVEGAAGRQGQARQVPAIVTAANPGSRGAEAVRTLRATLVAMAARRNMRTVLVVGADASVSSSRVAAELGVALAESGRRVLLVAADMRGSSLPQIFDVSNHTGLSELLVGGADIEMVIRRPKQASGVTLPSGIAKRLVVLPSGPQMVNALSVLDSNVMQNLLQGQRRAFDFVVLDSPPAVLAADVCSLAVHVDAVVVLASEAKTRGRAVTDLRHRLDQVGAVILGGVFIGKGKGGGHRRQPARPGRSAPGLPTAAVPSSVERRGSGPAPPSSAERRGSGSAAPARPASPVTRPLPAVRTDVAARKSPGGLAQGPP